MGNLTLKQAKRIVWFTWLEILVAGAIVVRAIDPFTWYLLFLSGILVVDSLYRLFKKSKDFPRRRYSVIPSIFQPSGFFAIIIIAFIFALYGEWNSWSWGLIVTGAAYFIASIPEAHYGLIYTYLKESVTLFVVTDFFIYLNNQTISGKDTF